MRRTSRPASSSISRTKSMKLLPVACSTFAMLSVDGHRGLPSRVARFDRLNVVGSNPDRRARPDAVNPFRVANRSIACQMSPWLSIERALRRPPVAEKLNGYTKGVERLSGAARGDSVRTDGARRDDLPYLPP